MSCHHSDILRLAASLRDMKPEEEVITRSAISRAYYSALHCVDVTFPHETGVYRASGVSSHEDVILRALTYSRDIGNPGNRYAAMVAKEMPKLRRFRNFADYELEETIESAEAGNIVRRVEKVIECCADVQRLRASMAAQA